MAETLEEIKQTHLDRLKNAKWHRNDYYFDEKAFLKTVKDCKFKTTRATKSFCELKKFLLTENNHVVFSECDENLIPLGRADDYADRDYLFFINTQNAIKNIDKENSFFVAYTGHCGAVGAALALEKIPLMWHLILNEDAFAEKRVIEQIQDYYTEISTPPNKNSSSLALLLESPHGDFKTFDISLFPTAKDLKNKGIKNVYLIDEYPADKDITLVDCKFYCNEFEEYITKLSKKFNFKIIPVDEKTNGKQLIVKKEKIKDPTVYYSNFNCKKH